MKNSRHSLAAATLAGVMTGEVTGKQLNTDRVNTDVPRSIYDLMACSTLLRVEGWKPRLKEMARVYPKWEPFVKYWDDLESRLTAAVESGELAHKLEMFMDKLNELGLRAEGWVPDGLGGWKITTEGGKVVKK